MTAGQICTKHVVVTGKDESIVDAAKRMRMFHVGDLVVMDSVGNSRRPIGIITDRDIVLSVVASDPSHLYSLLVSDVMSFNLAVANEQDDVAEVLKKMQAHGVRRMPVVCHAGSLVGILTFDDVLRALADDVNALMGVLAAEHMREERYRV